MCMMASIFHRLSLHTERISWHNYLNRIWYLIDSNRDGCTSVITQSEMATPDARIAEVLAELRGLLTGKGTLSATEEIYQNILQAELISLQDIRRLVEVNKGEQLMWYALSINYLLAQALHLLCVESYVFMCPFYYSNYQSILLCVESVIKFLSHNDVCVCLSIVLYLLIPHSYNPHLTSYLILRIC